MSHCVVVRECADGYDSAQQSSSHLQTFFMHGLIEKYWGLAIKKCIGMLLHQSDCVYIIKDS